MSDKSGGFPWAGLAVVAAFVASATLRPVAFEQLRPPEKERAQPSADAQLEVEARLWEDPFSAVRRHEAERLERCDKLFRDPVQIAQCKAPPASRQSEALDKQLIKQYIVRQRPDEAIRVGQDDLQHLVDGFLVMAVMVPGNSFVGAEEARRRTRYAVLAGLQNQGYLPDNAERLGLLSLPVGAASAPAQRGPVRTGVKTSPTSGETAQDTPSLLVPFELLSNSRLRSQRGDDIAKQARLAASAPAASAPLEPETYEQVLVLWIDETALPTPKLDAMAHALHSLYGNGEPGDVPGREWPRLAIIGPSSTDALRTGLLDLRDYNRWHPRDRGGATVITPDEPVASLSPQAVVSQVDYCRPTPPMPDLTLRLGQPNSAPTLPKPSTVDAVKHGYWLLAHASFYNPFSTASFEMLNVDPQAAKDSTRDLDRFLNQQFCRMFGGPLGQPVRMERTIATDDKLLELLVSELHNRLLGSKRRVVVVAERDSLYAQSLQKQLRRLLKEPAAGNSSPAGVAPRPDHGRPPLKLDVAYFFRGLDGVTTRDGAREGLKDDGGKDSKSGAPASIEWPESRAQLDYLRGLAAQLKDSEDPDKGGAIGAIGILASDVHDKLLILQALRDTFPDRVFFTTDMDSRLTHPRTQAFTRNLLVASSLPLRFPNEKSCKDPQPDGTEHSLRGKTLAGGNPPWRDVYQSSTYLAARLASCRSDECRATERCAMRQALDRPSLYEIGREDAVVLRGYARDMDLGRNSPGWWFAGLTLVVIVGLGLFVWPGSPSIHAAVNAIAGTARPKRRVGLAAGEVFFVLLYTLIGGLTLGSLVEVLWPGVLKQTPLPTLCTISVLAVVSAVMVRVALLPHRSLSGDRHVVMKTGEKAVCYAIGVAVPVIWLCVVVCAVTLPHRDCEVCEPAFWTQGVSAWPTQLLHLLALFCIVWTLDATWYRAQAALTADARQLHLPRPPDVSRRLRMAQVWSLWRGRFSVLTWPHPARGPCDGVDARQLWREYVRRAGRKPRTLRMLVAGLATIALMVLIYCAAMDGAAPTLPVRGVEDRQLFFFTLVLCLLGLPLVVVAVGDATLLTSRFIGLLGVERSFYPNATVRTFARELGVVNADAWAQPIACAPADRVLAPPKSLPTPGARHSLLDDWIDMQLVARRTERIAPLVIAPFVVLALLVVGRSRLFDAWSITLPIGAAAAAYLLGAVVLALQLKFSAEKARDRALTRMAEDLRWVQGCKPTLDSLVEPFKGLIQAVKDDRRGAFAPLFEQPLLRALLLPLGGAGGAQLLDYLLLAK